MSVDIGIRPRVQRRLAAVTIRSMRTRRVQSASLPGGISESARKPSSADTCLREVPPAAVDFAEILTTRFQVDHVQEYGVGRACGPRPLVISSTDDRAEKVERPRRTEEGHFTRIG